MAIDKQNLTVEAWNKLSGYLKDEIERARKGGGFLAFLGAYLPEDKQDLLGKIFPSGRKAIAEGGIQVSSVQMVFEKWGVPTFVTALSAFIDRGIAINTVRTAKGEFKTCVVTMRERLRSKNKLSDDEAVKIAESNSHLFHRNLLRAAMVIIMLKGTPEQKEAVADYIRMHGPN